MYKYFISICFLLVFVDGVSQEQQKDSILNDSIVFKSKYGLRLGIDISKPILAQLNSSYNGLEIVGDYRIKKNLYIAAELGYEEETTEEGLPNRSYFTNSTSKGNYIRLGINYNVYENWLDMNNEISIGYRYGFSLFDQTLNSYSPNVTNLDQEIFFPATIVTTPITATNLTAHWSEFQLGLKVETFNNFYVSFSLSYKVLMSVKDPDGFKSLYAPGFNRIFESNTGFGFNYTLSYLIPFQKK